MKRMIIMGVLILCTLFAQAQVGGTTIPIELQRIFEKAKAEGAFTTNNDSIPIPPFTKFEPLCPNPENDGWTLVNTVKKDDATIYNYTKEIDDEDKTCWVKKRDNGDFESSLSSDRRITFDGGVVLLVKDGLLQFVYPNGWIRQNRILYTKANGEYIGIREIGVKKSDIWDTPSSSVSGFLIGDRLYTYTDKGIFPFMQKFNGKYFYASRIDTIIDVKSSEDSLAIMFNNGNRYKRVYGKNGGKDYFVIDLHRSNVYIKKRKNDSYAYIEYDKGSKFECHSLKTENVQIGGGSPERLANWVDIRSDEDVCKLFAEETAELYGETWRNGSFRKYYFSDLIKEIGSQVKEVKKDRDYYVKKYGFYPGDYNSIKDILKPGRSIDAIKEYFAVCSLIRDNGTSQEYRVAYNWSSTRTYNAYVTVRNGNIVSVRFPD
ncbi:MAG: hypothetical protein J6T94_11440 [Bacteroidaceae bacterium]|nr:hypothetical protein [Bacteroidaceae bacterium]